jgi:MFS family permease
MKRKILYILAPKLYWRPLLGCCLAWFLYDFVVYPFNLLAPTLVSGFASHQTLVQKIGYSGLVNGFAIPGSLFGAFLLDRIGRKETYALGWAVVAVFGFAIGGSMLSLRHIFPLFVVLYGIFQSFLSVGPGNCNFFVSSESFPTPLRGYFLGFAAAVGKAGAAIGTTALSALLDSYTDQIKGQQVVFLVGSAISCLGTAIVWFMIPKVGTLLSR